jgi:polyisoprenoid-binding protein YceI
MTNYLSALAALLVAGGASAEPAAKLAAAPAGTHLAGAPHYRQGPGSTLTFTFDQAGAASQGSFKQFTTDLAFDEQNLAGSSLDVKVQISSLDTQDKDRDQTLAGADLFDVQKFPDATFVASSLARNANGKVEAAGKLTLRGVTRDLRIPLVIKPTATGLELTGETSINRLDYGIGQGEWKSTEWVGDTVKLNYKVALIKAAGG